MKNNLAMAMALSRLPPGEMSMVGRYQSRATSTAPVIGENKNARNARKRLIGENKNARNAMARKRFKVRL